MGEEGGMASKIQLKDKDKVNQLREQPVLEGRNCWIPWISPIKPSWMKVRNVKPNAI
jgi:hypothetical protein